MLAIPVRDTRGLDLSLKLHQSRYGEMSWSEIVKLVNETKNIKESLGPFDPAAEHFYKEYYNLCQYADVVAAIHNYNEGYQVCAIKERYIAACNDDVVEFECWFGLHILPKTYLAEAKRAFARYFDLSEGQYDRLEVVQF